MQCTTRNEVIRLALGGLLVFLVAIQTAGAAHIPASSKARTQKDIIRETQAWRYRTIIGAYAKAGNHAAKWDAAAKRFLYNYYREGAKVPDTPFSNALLNSGKALVSQGCDDSLVLSCYGNVLLSTYRTSEAAPILQRALDAFGKNRYHKARECMTIAMLIKARKSSGSLPQADYLKLIDRATSCIAQSMTDGSFLKGEQRLMLNALYTSNEDIYAPAGSRVRSSLTKAKGIDPYFLKTTCGLIETEEAWADRGDGWANSVTEAGWKGFYAHLQSASKLLTAAWKLHPEYPEAPTAMIRVAMGLGNGGVSDVRKWFDRAVSAELDHMEAYSQLQWALRPRWCGSIPVLYDFAVDCCDTRRFDTQVPWMFVDTLFVMESESRGSQAYWNTANTQRRLKLIFDGYAKSGYGKGPSWYRSVQAGLDWHCGRSAEAKALLKKLGSKVDSQAFYRASGAFPSSVLAGSGKASSPKAPTGMRTKRI